jgi:hypothetical protein
MSLNLSLDILADVQSKILRVDGEEGGRYYTIAGKKCKLPSVSTLLSKFEYNPYLVKWEQKLGKEEADKVRTAAANRGTRVHAAIEHYFEGKPVHLVPEEMDFFNVVNPVLKYVNPVYQEKMLYWTDDQYPDRVGFAGTADILFSIKGENLVDKQGNHPFTGESLVLGDWKTWKSTRSAKDCLGKYMQLAAYSAATNKITSSRVNRGMIIGFTNKNLYLYYVDPKQMMYYWNNFKKLVHCYFSENKFDWINFKTNALGEYQDETSVWRKSNNHFIPQRLYLAQ